MGLQSRSSSDAVLIVEGQDDRHVVGHLWHRQTGEEPPFDILDAGNDRKALSMFGLALRDPRRRAVGILVDADDNAPGRWEAVRRRLSDEDITAPIESNRDGIIIEANEDVPRVGVWLMPDNSSAGELEDFVVKMVPVADPVWPRSETYIDGIPPDARKFSEGKILRAKVHAWLATREEPRPMGAAIRTQDLSVDGELCQRFVAWLKGLFT